MILVYCMRSFCQIKKYIFNWQVERQLKDIITTDLKFKAANMFTYLPLLFFWPLFVEQLVYLRIML